MGVGGGSMIICFIELVCGQRHRSEVAKLGSFATSDLYLCQQPSSLREQNKTHISYSHDVQCWWDLNLCANVHPHLSHPLDQCTMDADETVWPSYLFSVCLL